MRLIWYLSEHHGVVDVGGDDSGGQAVGRVVGPVDQLLDHTIVLRLLDKLKSFCIAGSTVLRYTSVLLLLLFTM